jgi:hypothetical protein
MAQSLIEQLQSGAIDGSAPISDLLRRAKLAAVKLGAAEFDTWIEREMNGYHRDDPVPDYREVAGPVRFFNPYRGWCPILGMEDRKRRVRQPIAEVFELANTASGYLTIGVPEQVRKGVSQQIGFDVDVQQHISASSMNAIVEAVRNAILDWTLRLERAGIHGKGLSFTREETKAAQAMFVTNNYHGPIASISQGGTIHQISQQNGSTLQEMALAIQGLLDVVKQVGHLPTEAKMAADDLKKAQSDLQEGRVPFGRITSALDAMRKVEDIAVRAPEVVSTLHRIGEMFGLA